MNDRDDRMERLRRDTWRDVHQDGLTELVAGVVLMVVALAVARPAFHWWYLGVIVVLGPGLNRVRARFTYPRIGYAKLPSEKGTRLGRGVLLWFVGTFLAVALGLALLGVLGDRMAWRRAAPALGGLLFAGGFLYLAGRTGLKRVYALAAASAATGLLLVWPEIEGAYANLRVWALVMALLCFAVGGVVFFRFVRRNPVLQEWSPDVD